MLDVVLQVTLQATVYNRYSIILTHCFQQFRLPQASPHKYVKTLFMLINEASLCKTQYMNREVVPHKHYTIN